MGAVPRVRHRVFKAGIPIVDTRLSADFKKGHIKGAFNIQDGSKFETWLGSVINPDEQFYLIASDEEELEKMIRKAAKIGYENNIGSAQTMPDVTMEVSPQVDLATFRSNTVDYTIVDVRNWTEIYDGQIFPHALTIPLPELRERWSEIPTTKPIVVHCAAGYRSAAGTSIIAAKLTDIPVFDLGEAITEFLK
jgi:rhodanese-related sulfurtransferase